MTDHRTIPLPRALTAEDLRDWFEERVFGKRFLSSIGPTGMGGCLSLMSQGCPPKDELMTRDADGNYTDEAVSAMWFGFCLAVEHFEKRAPAPPKEPEWLAGLTDENRHTLADWLRDDAACADDDDPAAGIFGNPDLATALRMLADVAQDSTHKPPREG